MVEPVASEQEKPLRFDVAAVREAAGEKVFARGVEYQRNGRVEILAIEPARVLAKVMGEDIYRVELTGEGARISGRCSCPAFERGFCKHLVATALIANHAGEGEPTEATSRLSRIRAYLLAQGAATLTDKIMAWAERDLELLAELDLATMAETADERALFDRFRKALTDATRTRGFVDYEEAGGWAGGIERVLRQIEGLIARHPEMVLRLIDHGFDRIEAALESVDDSNGDGLALFGRIREIHLAACRSARPDPVGLAHDLFDKEAQSVWGMFDGVVESHADVLGEAGLAEFRRLAQDAWARLPASPPTHAPHDPESSARYRLKAILDGFAARDGDLDARLALRTSGLTSAYGYLEVAQVCLAHDREDLALSWAEEGLWRFEDRPDERLTCLAADLMRRGGQAAKAESLLWAAFARDPSLKLFHQIRGGGDPEAALDQAVVVLEGQLAAPPHERRRRSSGQISDLLVQLLTEAGRLSEAWQATRAHGCGEWVVNALAQLSEAALPEEALTAYARLVEGHIGRTSRSGYEAACALLNRMRRLRTGLGQDAAHREHLEQLATLHKAKRTFVQMLRGQANAGP